MKRLLTVLPAILTLGAFPIAAAMFAIPLSAYVFGFDDFPLGRMFYGFAIGIVGSGIGAFLVFHYLRRNALRVPVVVIVIAGLLDVIALPAGRWLTKLEQERRYETIQQPPAPLNASPTSEQ